MECATSGFNEAWERARSERPSVCHVRISAVVGNDNPKITGPGVDLLMMLEEEHIGQAHRIPRGRMLYWQGDPVENVYMIRSGAVKIFSTSQSGKTYAYGVIGKGGMAGVTSVLMGKNHEFVAEVLEDTELIAIPTGEFERLLEINPRFAMLVMKKLAEEINFLASNTRDFGFLDVQQRIKRRLIELAREHGVATNGGIRIDLDLSHEEIGALVAANRSTVTSFLNELERQGYLWREGRHLVISSPEHIEILDKLNQAVLDGNEEEARKWAQKSIEEGVDPVKALDALANGMKLVDRMFARDEMDLSDVILSAFAMKNAIPMIEAEIEKSGKEINTIATVVIGTVFGDIHDIGRTLVAMLLKARGFKVIDLGNNVSASKFVEAVRVHDPDILAMSSLMTTGTQEQFKIVQELVEAGLRDRVKIIVGGGAITQKLCDDLGADGYEPTAYRAVELAWRLTHSVS